MSPTQLARTLRDLLDRGGQPPAKLGALLVLALFVIWLLAAGYDLASAVAAAVAVSWAAGGGTLPLAAGVLPDTAFRLYLPVQPQLADNPSSSTVSAVLTSALAGTAATQLPRARPMRG